MKKVSRLKDMPKMDVTDIFRIYGDKINELIDAFNSHKEEHKDINTTFYVEDIDLSNPHIRCCNQPDPEIESQNIMKESVLGECKENKIESSMESEVCECEGDLTFSIDTSFPRYARCTSCHKRLNLVPQPTEEIAETEQEIKSRTIDLVMSRVDSQGFKDWVLGNRNLTSSGVCNKTPEIPQFKGTMKELDKLTIKPPTDKAEKITEYLMREGFLNSDLLRYSKDFAKFLDTLEEV